MTDFQIRRAGPGDSDSVAALLTQLGYPTAAAGLPARLQRMSLDDRSGAHAFYLQIGLQQTGRRFGKALT